MKFGWVSRDDQGLLRGGGGEKGRSGSVWTLLFISAIVQLDLGEFLYLSSFHFLYT